MVMFSNNLASCVNLLARVLFDVIMIFRKPKQRLYNAVYNVNTVAGALRGNIVDEIADF